MANGEEARPEPPELPEPPATIVEALDAIDRVLNTLAELKRQEVALLQHTNEVLERIASRWGA